MISFNLILPELNEFLTLMGGQEHKGLIIALFTVSAAVSRPFSGKLSDTIGRKKVMIFGIIVAILATLLYPVSGALTFFLLLRFAHGFSAGFMPTGATALITDILPEQKRGVGMGIWGVFISSGIGIGQWLGSVVRHAFEWQGLFMVAAGSAVISVILIGFIKETLPNPVKFRWSLMKIKWNDVFEPSVMPAAVVMFLSATSSGVIFVITPDMCDYMELENKGWFLGFYTLSTIFVRLFTGGLSDKIGRRKTLIIGMSLLLLSMVLVTLTKEWIMFTVAATVFGIATGVSSPTLFAWTADLSHPKRRGVGAGTLFIALELGIMLGAGSTLLLYSNSMSSIPFVFGFPALLAFLCVLYLFWHLNRKESVT